MLSSSSFLHISLCLPVSASFCKACAFLSDSIVSIFHCVFVVPSILTDSPFLFVPSLHSLCIPTSLIFLQCTAFLRLSSHNLTICLPYNCSTCISIHLRIAPFLPTSISRYLSVYLCPFLRVSSALSPG